MGSPWPGAVVRPYSCSVIFPADLTSLPALADIWLVVVLCYGVWQGDARCPKRVDRLNECVELFFFLWQRQGLKDECWASVPPARSIDIVECDSYLCLRGSESMTSRSGRGSGQSLLGTRVTLISHEM